MVEANKGNYTGVETKDSIQMRTALEEKIARTKTELAEQAAMATHERKNK